MKQLNCILAGLTALGLNLAAKVDSGAQAPEFTLTDTAGESHALSDYAGRYVILEWSNRGCPFVKKYYEDGHMQALQEEMTADGAAWFHIVSSAPGKQGHLTPDQGAELLDAWKMRCTALLLDPTGKVGRMYGARTTPHMFVIDPDGTLIYQGAIDSIPSTSVGDIDKATNYVKAAYESDKAGEPVAEPSTTPYGCGVKY